MKVIKKILFGYNFILISALFYQGIRQFKSTSDLALILLIASSALYFIASVFSRLSKLDKLINWLEIISLLTTSILLVVATFGLIFSFEYIFIIIIFPLPLYFMLIVFYKQSATAHIEKVAPKATITKEKTVVNKLDTAKEEINKESIGDPLKRKFIKIIGGTGVGILIASLISPKKAEAAFFGSVPGPGTVAVKDSNDNKIDPAIKSPIDAYGVTEIDDSSPSYYGFVNKEGSWYITRETDDGSYRYSKGGINFSSNWLDRDNLTYGYFDTIF